MLNAEKYEDVIIDAVEDTVIDDPICELHNARTGSYNCDNDCDACKRNVLRWLCQEYVKPILNDSEKIILRDIVKAFEQFGYEIKYIGRYSWSEEENDFYLSFQDEHYNELISPTLYNKTSKMFKEMELEKDYTLEELGLNDA